MKTKIIVLSLLAVTFSVGVCAGSQRTISIQEYRDKMEAGWIGQMAGVAWTARTEFKFNDRIIPIDETTGLPELMPVWTPSITNQAFWQDDLYVEMTFLRSLEEHGFDISYKQAGIDFANTGYQLWIANAVGRSNLRKGIAPPDTGHPQFHNHPNAIDYQIEADYSGLIAPGLPQVPIDLGEKFGRMMNYSDGVYGGQFIGAMYSEAFFETDMCKVVEKGLEAIPAESQYAEVVRDVLAWYKEGIDWKVCWQRVEDKYAGPHYSRPNAKNNYLEMHSGGIDVRVNGAYVVMGLLYGEGDLDQTIIISARCGKDSDCNPSNAAGILFTSIGMKNLPVRFTSQLNRNTKFSHTPYNFTSLSEVCLKLAKIAIVREGGNVVGNDATGHFVIPQKTVTMKPYVSAARPEPIANSLFTAEEMALIVVSDARIKKEFAEIFPGWEIINCADMTATGKSNQRVTGVPGEEGSAFITLPKNAESPCVIKKSVNIPAEGKTALKLTVGCVPDGGGAWQLMVRVDMADHYVKTIQKPNTFFWQNIEIDLSEFAGQKIDLELYNNPIGDWTESYAVWKSIEIAEIVLKDTEGLTQVDFTTAQGYVDGDLSTQVPTNGVVWTANASHFLVDATAGKVSIPDASAWQRAKYNRAFASGTTTFTLAMKFSFDRSLDAYTGNHPIMGIVLNHDAIFFDFTINRSGATNYGIGYYINAPEVINAERWRNIGGITPAALGFLDAEDTSSDELTLELTLTKGIDADSWTAVGKVLNGSTEVFSWNFGGTPFKVGETFHNSTSLYGSFSARSGMADSKISNRTVTSFLATVPIASGLDVLGAEAALLYPNPVKDILNVSSSDVKKIEIFNLSGKLVKSLQLKGSQVDVSELAKGVYIVKLNGSTTAMSKFVKK